MQAVAGGNSQAAATAVSQARAQGGATAQATAIAIAQAQASGGGTAQAASQAVAQAGANDWRNWLPGGSAASSNSFAGAQTFSGSGFGRRSMQQQAEGSVAVAA
jgi:hypothetical protein